MTTRYTLVAVGSLLLGAAFACGGKIATEESPDPLPVADDEAPLPSIYRKGGCVLTLRAMTRALKRLGWTTAMWRYLRDRDASVFGKLLAVFAVAYVIMPLDLIPDVPFIGWLDDIGVVALVGAWMTRRISEYREPSEDGRVPPPPSRRPFSVMP